MRGCASCRRPGIHNPESWLWIPGSREGARPGMTGTALRNTSTIVRGLIGRGLMCLRDESRRAGRFEHTDASPRARALAGDAGRRCRDRPHLCQPARTRTGEPERRGAGKTGARADVDDRGILPRAARRGSAQHRLEPCRPAIDQAVHEDRERRRPAEGARSGEAARAARCRRQTMKARGMYRILTSMLIAALAGPALAEDQLKSVKTTRIHEPPPGMTTLYAIDEDGTVRIDWSTVETVAATKAD